MTDQHRTHVIEIIKPILQAMHDDAYDKIPSYVDHCQSGSDMSMLREGVQGTLEVNGHTAIDVFGVPCRFFEPPKDIQFGPQLDFREYKDGSGFAVDYQLTSNAAPVDMVLQLSFLYAEGNSLKSVFVAVDPQ